MASPIHHEDTNSSYYSTLKLSLSNLPKKPRNYNDPRLASAYTTPPLHPSVSIPFQWEEAPGKPKSPTSKSKTVRCLDLPPRLTLLLSEAGKITNTPSPTTVLDGPYVGRSFSCVNESAFEKKEEIIDKDRMMRSSGRWENLKEDNFDFSGPLSNSISRNAYDLDTKQSKFLRFTRKGSVFNNSNLLEGIYESFKQAVPWRWRRTKTKRNKC
ncbi:unnamed protein product [Withania somnifera]